MIGNPRIRNINYKTDELGNLVDLMETMPDYLIIEESDSLTVARLKQEVQIENADEIFKVENQT